MLKTNTTIMKTAEDFTDTQAVEGKVRSDGSTASYYELPKGITQLQHLISHRDMNAQIGEIFRACYRYGLVEHSPKVRDIKKILFYAQAELERLIMLEEAWTDEDDAKLRLEYPDPDVCLSELAEVMGKSLDTIIHRAKSLGLTRETGKCPVLTLTSS